MDFSKFVNFQKKFFLPIFFFISSDKNKEEELDLLTKRCYLCYLCMIISTKQKLENEPGPPNLLKIVSIFVTIFVIVKLSGGL